MKTKKHVKRRGVSKFPSRIPRGVLGAIFFILMFAPPSGVSAPGPYEQEFMLTAYYSPLPDQCCYVKGTYAADVILNGHGTHSADGTEVYPGMVAAPPTYAFGTRIELPGLGTVTVHDRGGAIQELPNGAHRADVWVGHGEEGLARALAFGVQHIKGTVYPVGSAMPGEAINLAALPAPPQSLRPYLAAEPDLLSLHPKLNDHNLSVELLQKHLKDAGYFTEAINGNFGPETKKSLETFNKDFGLDQPSDQLTERTAAFLSAAVRQTHREPLAVFVERESSQAAIIRAQRTLRFLGYYRGRTNGLYDDKLFAAILSFQKDQGLVGSVASPGAGRIGPKTKTRIALSWKKRLVTRGAERLLALRKIDDLLVERDAVIDDFLGEGDHGDQVKRLQRLLVARGFFPTDRISGLFGTVTRDAVVAYQLQKSIIENVSDRGAGFVGPATISSLKRDLRSHMYQTVRAEGWAAL